MEQMTVGMTSYVRSISKLQTSTSATPAPSPSKLSSMGSVILVGGWRLRDWMKVRMKVELQLSLVHLCRVGDCGRRESVNEIKSYESYVKVEKQLK